MNRKVGLTALTVLAMLISAGCKGGSDAGKDNTPAPQDKAATSSNALPNVGSKENSLPNSASVPDHGNLPLSSESDRIEGRWFGTIESGGKTMPLTLEFVAPDKLKSQLDVASGKLWVNLTGTYKLEGDMLTMKYSDATLAGAKAPPESGVKQFEAGKKAMLADLNSDPTGKIQWVDEDTFKMENGAKEPVTFKRLKSAGN